MCGADSWFGAHRDRTSATARRAPRSWLPIRVGGADGIGLDEVGVIAAMATPLAQASVPVLYVSAFSNDYVLVPAALTDVSVEAFENQGFVSAAPPLMTSMRRHRSRQRRQQELPAPDASS